MISTIYQQAEYVRVLVLVEFGSNGWQIGQLTSAAIGRIQYTSDLSKPSTLTNNEDYI